MAKNDNLTDFLTDIADTIREKCGLSDNSKINPQDFTNYIIRPPMIVTMTDIDGNGTVTHFISYKQYGNSLREEEYSVTQINDNDPATTISVLAGTPITISSNNDGVYNINNYSDGIQIDEKTESYITFHCIYGRSSYFLNYSFIIND